ncbi:MAG: DNA-directed RNA polymerase subunit omega [Bacilli bacterium]|nr:DNA-directed RNA polymerase subunit omega [Bacilli bacterium]
MIYPSIDKLLNIVDSKYELVHIAAKRARQIEKESFYQMKENEYESAKPIGRALEELSQDLIKLKD